MSDILHIVKIKDGEEILFGPIRRADQSNLLVHSQEDSRSATHTSIRSVCISNQRVIIESGDSAIHIPNKDITAILIAKKKASKSFHLIALNSISGNTIQMDMPNIPLESEAQLRQLFPTAKLVIRRGFSGWLRTVFKL